MGRSKKGGRPLVEKKAGKRGKGAKKGDEKGEGLRGK